MSDTAGKKFDLMREVEALEVLAENQRNQWLETRGRLVDKRAELEDARKLQFEQEQARLAAQPIADRDGYESAELYAKERQMSDGAGR